MDCHGPGHNESSFLQQHTKKNITCIDCHSDAGVTGYVDSRKEMIDAILFESSKPLLNVILHNDSYNMTLIHLAANCTKCHTSVESKFFNHTNITGCGKCHFSDITSEYFQKGLLEIGTGGHRNKTCRDCHSTNFRIPNCTDCHRPHKENAKWENKVCLDCHNSPHIPVRNGIFNAGIEKENCAVCHENQHNILEFYNSKHNQLGSCADCHPVHKEKKSCMNCHRVDHTNHPFAQNNCNACHGRSTCKDCHKDPHAPLRGLPRINDENQFNEYAAKRLH